MTNLLRTYTCGALRGIDVGKAVVLNGWVNKVRNHGGISFIDVRDRYGITQVFAGDEDAALKETAAALKNEFCVVVEGEVRARPPAMVNNDMPTGAVEVVAKRLVILSRSETPPFQIDEAGNVREELRLKYRYLDLRSQAMQRRIKLRNDVTFAARAFLEAEGFLEIETPTFIKSTPEGARDYLVPSRLYPGQFYALPQSPQLYKQILMVAGFDKYFQIARCYRDEDARGDRQPEFTQIDIEMSFVGREQVLSLTERLMGHIFERALGVTLPTQFTRLTYEEALETYGTDKPDLRFGMTLRDFAPFVRKAEFRAFKEALDAGGAVKALVVKKDVMNAPNGGKEYSRKQIEELEAQAKIYKAAGMAWMKVNAAGILEGGVSKFFVEQQTAICAALDAGPGDLVLIVGGAKRKVVNTALGAVRTKLGHDLRLCDSAQFAFVWIIDFPLFEFNEEEGRWEAAHHMFSRPQEEFIASLEKDPGAVKGDLYDLVLNGCELASGSIRIHESDLQKRIFSIVGFDPENAEKRFGFLTEAFKYGAPPHGGIAPGLDRLVMLMAGETSIKEVIAFPKNSFAQSPMDECPGEVDAKQLRELHLAITGNPTGSK
ncbi:MAG: aspartate--tRNA ligase [Spirochaetaceae bacterium]|jgi:aspartyl-tRNA synthetase|nr:aspartate--tRNA ligase [Spirochaetaceae bacterium]